MSKPKNSKPETNTQFITRMMEFSPHGALSQMFVIAAIDNYSRLVVANPPMENSIVDGDAWKRTAEWMQEELDKR